MSSNSSWGTSTSPSHAGQSSRPRMTGIRLWIVAHSSFGSVVSTDTVALALAGAGNGIAQFWWTRSLTLAPPSAFVPFNYLSLVWATVLGFAIWGDLPTLELLLGAVIV